MTPHLLISLAYWTLEDVSQVSGCGLRWIPDLSMEEHWSNQNCGATPTIFRSLQMVNMIGRQHEVHCKPSMEADSTSHASGYASSARMHKKSSIPSERNAQKGIKVNSACASEP